jgi:hypothetical protein
MSFASLMSSDRLLPQVGLGRVSLEKLLADQKDFDGALDLVESGSKAVIGTLVCAVKGFSALKLIADEADGKTPAAAKGSVKGSVNSESSGGGAPATDKPAAAAPSTVSAAAGAGGSEKAVDVAALATKYKMTFQLHSLTLGGKAKKKPPAHLRIWIEVPAADGKTLQLGSSVHKGDEKTTLKWSHAHGLAVGSAERRAFFELLANKDDKEASNVTFLLYGLSDKEAKQAGSSDKKPEGSILGKAKLNLVELMKLGDDVEERKLELADADPAGGKEGVGTLVVSLACTEALSEFQKWLNKEKQVRCAHYGAPSVMTSADL